MKQSNNIVEELKSVKIETKLTFDELKRVIDKLAAENKTFTGLSEIKSNMEEIESELSQSDSSGSFNILPLSIKDLSETYQILEQSANAILDDAEKIMSLSSDPKVTEHLMQICQNCNFHDLAGQRIMRVSKNLQKFENTALTVLSFALGKDVKEATDYESETLMNGPALKGAQASSQDDVDKLFS